MRTLTLFFAFFFTLAISCCGESTLLKVNSEPGDPLGGGIVTTLTSSEATFSGAYDTYYGATSLSVKANGSGNNWKLTFYGPANGPLQPGVYENAEWIDSYRATAVRPRPAMAIRDISIYPWFPGESDFTEGRFEVKKVIYGPNGQLLSFWAFFEQKVRGSAAKLTGEIQYNADSTAAPTKQNPKVYAGANPTRVAVGVPVQLSGILQDDGVPTDPPVRVDWSANSNAANVEIEDPNSLNTRATFRAAGDYYLRLRVTSPVFPFGSSHEVYVRAIDVEHPTFLRAVIPDGDKYGVDNEMYFDLFNANFYCHSSQGGIVTFTVTSGNRDERFSFAPIKGGKLTPGRYEDVKLVEYSSGDLWEETMSWNRTQAVYPTTDRRRYSFEIFEITWDPSGNLLSFWAAVEIQGSLLAPPGFLELRYNASTGSLANQPPLVNAGQDREFLSNSVVRLNGNATDSSIPAGGGLQMQWSQVSGPATAAIVDPSSANTAVTLPEIGTYVFRLTATDGYLSGSDDVAISQTDRQSGLSLHFNSSSSYSFSDWDLNEGFVSVVSWTGDAITLAYQRPFDRDRSELKFLAPKGQSLKPGNYAEVVTGAEIYSDWEGKFPHLESSFPISGQRGSFEIKELDTASDGTVLSFRATVALTSSETIRNIVGEVRYRSGTENSAPNTAPRVTVSDSAVVPSGASPLIHSYADDDGLPFGKARTYRWTQESGAPASIANPDQPNTEVSLPGEGEFRFRMTVSDGELESSAVTALYARTTRGTFEGGFMISDNPFGKVTISYTGGNSLSVRISTLFKTGRPVAKLKEGVYTCTYPLGPGKEGTLRIVQLDNGAFAGILSEPTGVGEFIAHAPLSGLLNATKEDNPFASRYNFSVAPQTAGNGPVGDGIGGVNVGRDGRWRSVASLADGTKISQGGVVGNGGQLTFFSPLPRKGRFAGVMFLEREDLTLSGNLLWHRLNRDQKTKFIQVLIASGEPYVRPEKGRNPLTQDDSPFLAKFEFESPFSDSPITRTIPLNGGLHWTNGAGFTVRFDPTTGFFSGRFRHEDWFYPFRGAVFQSTRTGRGYFIGFDRKTMMNLLIPATQ